MKRGAKSSGKEALTDGFSHGNLWDMIFFKRKKNEESARQEKLKSLQEIVTERVLTAHGWRKRMEKQLNKEAKK